MVTRFIQPLENGLSQSQISFDSDDDAWSLTADELVFTEEVPWASDTMRSYLLEDVSPATLDAAMDAATVEIRDTDGNEVGTQTEIDVEYTTPKADQSDTGETTAGVATGGDEDDETREDDRRGEIVEAGANGTAREQADHSPDTSAVETPSLSPPSGGTETQATTESDGATSDPGDGDTAVTVAGETEPSQDATDDSATDVETTSGLPVTPREYVLQDVSDDVDPSEFSWETTDSSDTNSPSDATESGGLLARLRSWF